MLGQPISQTLLIRQAQVMAQSYLDQARMQGESKEHPKWALALYGQAKAIFKYTADEQGILPLAEAKNALNQARTSQTAEAETLRQRIAEIYFERAQLLEKLGKADKAQASYHKAAAWGHLEVADQPSRKLAEAALHSAALMGSSLATIQSGGTLPPSPQQDISHSSSPIPAEIPSILFEPAQNAESSLYLATGVEEKNKLVNLLFEKTLQTFQEMKLGSVLPSAFLVYAHDNSHYGTADAATSKFLIHQLFELGINMYSDQTPKGRQAQASFSTPQDAARTDDILTSQLCLLPTAIGSIQSVEKVIICSSQVLGHYLQWEHYPAYCQELKAAYGLGLDKQNPTQVEAQIRQVVNTYVGYTGFHHVLTEMAFLKIRAEYLDQHGIIPVSLSADGYNSCCQDFIQATTVRIEDMPRFASQQASGQQVYEDQGRHLVFFKVLERLLARHDAEALLRVFWTGYADLIKRLNNEAASLQLADYLPVWDRLFKSVRATLQTLKEQVGAQELQTALTRYASLDRLAIQRLSGPALAMKNCYINLAIVEHERKEEEETEEGKEKEMAPSPLQRLPSSEAIASNSQKLIPLKQLFEPRKLSDGKEVLPKRILIRGRAGVGKTILSKKIVYDYTQKAQWRDRFDYLLQIPLRTLKGKQHCDWVTLFHETYFHTHPKGLALAQALAAQIKGPAQQKTLFVLDGWDEVAQEWGEHEPMAEFLKDLLNQPAVLITSRPFVELKQADPMDLELETVGFSPENVIAYLDNPAMLSLSQGQEIKHFIQTNAFIQELVNVPIQLDALCYSWDEIKRMQQEAPGEMTVTALYQAMMNKLWRKDMLRLGKREDGKLLSVEAAHALRRTARIEQAVQTENDFLSALAFQGLQDNRIEFDTAYLDNLIEQLMLEGVSLPLVLETNLKKLSFLHTDDAEESQRSYHFMHLTFQEFFAAKHFVAHWKTGRQITLLSAHTQRWKKAPPEAFVHQHKYNPRYEIFWWFVSGLLRGAALERFFALLEAEPRDLFGASHQRLIISSLHEASRAPAIGLPSEIRDGLEQHLAQWLQWEIDKTGASTLAHQPTFPEHVLLNCLNEAVSEEIKQAVATAFRYRSTFSASALPALLALAENQDNDMKYAAAQALGKLHSLPESGLKALLALAKDDSKSVSIAAARALSKLHSLSESALQALLALAQDKNSNVKRDAAEVLGKLPSLPESALPTLLVLAEDQQDSNVRRDAAKALGKLSSLPESALQALLALAQDKNSNVKRDAAEVLGKLPSLPESALPTLLVLAEDQQDSNVRRDAAKALGKLSSLPESALQALLALAEDEAWIVRRDAAEALCKLPSLPEPALQVLLKLPKDKSVLVKRATTYALGARPSLPESALLALIALTKDKNSNVKRDAAEALGKQPSLSESALLALIALTKDWDSEVQSSAAVALSKQLPLPESVLQILLELAQDKDRNVRHAATKVLGKLPSLPERALPVLLALAKVQDREVMHDAIKALGNQPSLPESALLALLELAKDEDREVMHDAIKALGKQPSLPESALQVLLELAKNKDSSVLDAAAEALGKQPSLPESALQVLLELAEDKNWLVKYRAARALGNLPSLSKSALQALLMLAEDKDSFVQDNAVEALGKQPSLPKSALPVLLKLTEDHNSKVRRAAVEALGKQSSLPKSALRALLELAKNKYGYIKVSRTATDMLNKHHTALYRLLPTLSREQIQLFYTVYLLRQRLDQSVPFYTQGDMLCFYTAEGLQTIPLGDKKDEFKEAILQTQQAIGIPRAIYPTMSGQIVSTDAQNMALVNQSASSPESTQKNILESLKRFA